MSSATRTSSPAPKKSPASKESPAPKKLEAPGASYYGGQGIMSKTHGNILRRQSRPVNEFGGNLGAVFWSLYIPAQIYHLYGCCVLGRGEFLPPNQDFWSELLWGLPAGIAIRPTWKGFWTVTLFMLFQAACELLMPYKVEEGVPLKNGKRLQYPINGLGCFLVTHIAQFSMLGFGLVSPDFVMANIGSMLTCAVLWAYVISLWLYVDFGLMWKRHINDPEFEEDTGVFFVGECFTDFWNGVVRNPRILHGTSSLPIDLKRFASTRIGGFLWVALNWGYLFAIYRGCQLQGEMRQGWTTVCSEKGDVSRLGLAPMMITLAHFWYIFDNVLPWNEPWYLHSTDIRHDLFGFMLCYGCIGMWPFFYSIAFMGHIVYQREPLQNNWYRALLGTVVYVVCMVIWRRANFQKHHFRKYIADGGDLSTYKVWGKPVQYIKTEVGSYLLTSGWWSLARRLHYLPDMVMCLGWMLACTSPSSSHPFGPFMYCAYFWVMDLHRLWREEYRCSAKYKQDWERYKDVVPYVILPGII